MVNQAASQARTPDPRDDSPVAGLVRRWLLFGFFLLITFPELERLMPWPISRELLLYALVALTGVKMVLQQDKRWREDIHVHVAFAVLLAYMALRLSTSRIYFFADPDEWVDCFLVLLLFRFWVRAREDILWILWACTCTLLLWPVLFFLFSVQSHPWVIHIRSREFLEMLGALPVFFLPVAVTLLQLRRAGIDVRLWWVLLVLNSIMLILTGARSAWMAAVLSTFLSAWYLRRHVSPREILYLGGRAFGILVPVFLISVVLWVTGCFTPELTIGVFSARWDALLAYMLECPLSFLVGYGPLMTCERVGYLPVPRGDDPFRVFLDFGLIGLSLFGALFWALLSRARATLGALPESLRPVQSAFLLGFVGYLIAVSFGSHPRMWLLVWAYAGLMLNLGSQAPSESVRSVPFS